MLQSSNWVLLQAFGVQHRFSTSCPKSHQFPANLLSASKEYKKKNHKQTKYIYGQTCSQRTTNDFVVLKLFFSYKNLSKSNSTNACI